MSATDLEAFYAAVREDLKVFLQQSFNTVYPGKELMDNWHIDAIVHSLEESIRGRRPRSIINLPPRQLKSFIVSVALPAYILGNDPTAKIICISYSDDLAKTLSRDFGRIVEADWYRGIFPEVRRKKFTESEFVTDQGGSRYATSINGTLTGRGGDFIIIDDPIKPEDTLSDSKRLSTNEWYKSTLLSRLDDKARSVLIIVMQRLHINDLTGFAESSGGFEKLSLPAIATQDENVPVSETEYYPRAEGELLHEAREDNATIAAIKDQVGPFIFQAQYQQKPECPDGELIKRRYLNIVNGTAGIASGGFHWISVDSALSTTETADFSAISIGYSNRDGHYVLFAERGRWDYESLKDRVLAHAKRHRDVTFIVEEAGSGISLLQYLRRSGANCFWHRPNRDKVERAALVLPIFHAGRVNLVSQEGRNSWIDPYINELVSFPHGRFDDQVDSLVQALRWAEPRANPQGRIYFI